MACIGCKGKRMRYRLDVYRATTVSDGLGGFKNTWSKADTIRAAVEFSSIRDSQTGETLVPGGNAKATVRAVAGLTAGDYVKIGEHEYKVVGVEPADPVSRYVIAHLRMNEHGSVTDGQ